ncbi:MAG: carboxylating nicotinate-nucleotide diphosphorylase [Acidimicrobiales bacterium]|nr:carboxylating nicotinate-nucleotide diphosphorylase [Acidimicrobiales bacterium]
MDTIRSDLEPPRHAVIDAVGRALAEDLTPLGDLTSALLPAELEARASFVVRKPGVLAGVACATEAFRAIDPTVVISWSAADGDAVSADQTIGVVHGKLRSILAAERTALNFLGHLSGIATLTRHYVEAAEQAAAAVGRRVRIWDTRKTTPGLRSLEKAAVRAGGGANHRGNLSDWILLKDNHLALVGITEAVAHARERWPGRAVHVECDRYEQVLEAVDAGADSILLDNMSPDEVSRCVGAVDERVAALGATCRRPLLEVSGGVTLETVTSYAATGIDLISVGSITNSAPVLDIGLDIETHG